MKTTLMMKRFAVGILSSAMLASAPSAFAVVSSGTLTLTGTVPLTASVAVAGGAGANLAAGAGVATFSVPVSAAIPGSIASMFTVTYSANGTTNTVALTSGAATAGNLVNGANLLPYTLTCAACSVAAATALVGTPTTFDATATPQAAKVLTFQFNFTAATAALPAGNYVDTITVDVTAL